jgi:TBC1 domain family member 5
MANAEVGGISPSRAWRGGARFATQKIGESRSSDPVDLVRRVASLKKRDNNLAEMLSDALNDLQHVKKSVANLDSQATEALDRALERISTVQMDLQDSGGSTPTIPTQVSTKQEVVSEKMKSAKIDEEPEVVPGSATLSPMNEDRKSETQATGSATTTDARITAAPSKPQAPSAPSPPSRPTPTSLPRRPLAQSEFSWMLGDTTHRSSFVSSASLPPDQSRQSESQSRQGSLFGETRDETREQSRKEDDDSLSLSSFT